MAARTAEEVRQSMEQGSLNLRGVASALRHLADRHDEEDADLLRLLARDVHLEADAMGEAEAFLLVTKDPAEPTATSYRPAPRATRLRAVEKEDARDGGAQHARADFLHRAGGARTGGPRSKENT